jgi:hypothetical protein
LRSAAVQWEAILGEHPADLFALKCAQNAYIFVNDPMALQDVAARVVDHQQQHTKMDPIAERFCILNNSKFIDLDKKIKIHRFKQKKLIF